MHSQTRRRTLLALGTVGSVALAGCGEEPDEPDAEEGTGNGQDAEDDPDEAGDGT